MVGCSTPPHRAENNVERPTLLRAIVSPSAFHGKHVLFTGYCRLEFEGKAIYLSKEDYQHGLGNMVWLEFDKSEITPAMTEIEYCLVEGTFSATNRGHMGVFSRAVENITRYESWPPW